MTTKPKLGHYYKSREPGFGWSFYVKKVFKDEVLAHSSGDVSYYLTEKNWKYWSEVTSTKFAADSESSSKFFDDWHNDKS